MCLFAYNNIQIYPNSHININNDNSSTSSSVSNRFLDNHKGTGGDSSVSQNINGLARKIISNVKDNLNMHALSASSTNRYHHDARGTE